MPGKLFANFALTVVLLALVVTALVVANRQLAPQRRVLPVQGVVPPDFAALGERITEASVRADLEAILDEGSRFTGSEGAAATTAYVAGELESLGFVLHRLPHRVTVPVTRHARLLGADGELVTGVTIHPLLPNWFRTSTTPAEGITGTVYRGQTGLAREFEHLDLRGNIVLLPTGTNWTTVAGMGAAAILYVDDPQRPAEQNWSHSIEASIDVPRFLVRGDAEALVGQTVTLEARQDYVPAETETLVAILRGGASDGTEAVVVTAHLDAFSYAPDLAPGAQPAASVAALLASARELARDAEALRRDVVLVATTGHAQGTFGMREFLTVLGPSDDRGAAAAEAAAALEAAKRAREAAEAVAAVAEEAAYWSARDAASEAALWHGRAESVREAFEQTLSGTLDLVLEEANEASTQARVAWVRAGMPVRTGDGSEAAAFAEYNRTRDFQQRIQSLGTMAPGQLKEAAGKLEGLDLAGRMEAEAQRRLTETALKLEQATARQAAAAALARYRRALVLGIDLTAGSGRIAMVCAAPDEVTSMMPADAEVAAQMRAACEGLDGAGLESTYVVDRQGRMRFMNLVRADDARGLAFMTNNWGAPRYFQSRGAMMAGHPAFTLSTLDDARPLMGTPADTPERMLASAALANVRDTTRVTVAALVLLARGHGRILPITQSPSLKTIHGSVVSRIGDNLVPNHQMRDSLVLAGPLDARMIPPPGMGRTVAVSTDSDGAFRLESLWPSAVSVAWGLPLSFDAARLEPRSGAIQWALSYPQSGPARLYAAKDVPLAQAAANPLTIVVFRAAPVQLFAMPDPTTLRPFASVDLLESRTMAQPRDFKLEPIPGGGVVALVPPESRLYFTFKKGSRDNPQLMEVRAFALNAEGAASGEGWPENAGEIYGEGYFAADQGSIINVELDVALSMAQVNARRVAMHDAQGMADDMLLDFSSKAVSLATASQELADEARFVDAKRTAWQSLAYSVNIHPVIRKNAADAIVGILFYLALAIPFAIFTEKLLVAHADIRIALLYQGLIFIAFFGVLAMIHPAYELVRSPYMILLGFVTLVLALMISGFVTTKFSNNVAQLSQRLHDSAQTADVSRGGAAATAFVLGLNNMRKRPVRTGLTMATLILITFVMICFTSVNTSLVDVEFAVGQAPYTGMLIRDPQLADVRHSVAPVQEIYGEDHLVAPRGWAGTFAAGGTKAPQLMEYTIAHTEDGRTREVTANAILGLTPQEIEITPIRSVFDSFAGWFESNSEQVIYLPRDMADELGIYAADVERGDAEVTLSGRVYTVRGIFDPDNLDAMADLDGESLIPLDVFAMALPGRQQASQSSDGETDVPADVARLPARSIAITPYQAMPTLSRVGSIAVALQGLDYAASREVIRSHLERSGQPAYYGIDGIAFYGGRFRRGSLEGLLDLLLPIIIAALTVLNTMRGSVYERRSELFVFNAVGLAPNHIRFLFIAEACVYAVVGAVGGYLLAQSLGAVLGFFDLTAGLSLNYSSLAAVGISIVIMAVVFISSIFPARMAAEIAAPSSTMTRKRATAEGDGDTMALDLPFTFNRRDRIAIIPYFVDWLENYGEGSAAEFFCAPPQTMLRADDQGNAEPVLTTTAWLRPYDLGVSQQVDVVVRTDAATGDHVATVTMTRLSGDRDSWERCNHAFIGLVRKRFLTWRAVQNDDRVRLLERGRRLLAPHLEPPGAQAPDTTTEVTA